MSAFQVLHLSDIHIGDTYIKSKDIALKIVCDLMHNKLCKIKCIVVSGDIFEGKIKASPALIKEAVDFFKIIIAELNNSNKENDLDESDVLIVPGNHDIIRVDKPAERWDKYKEFLINFYGSIPDYYGEEFTFVKPYHDNKIVFVGFNSCQLEKNPLFDSEELKKINILDESKITGIGTNKNDLIELLKSEQDNNYEDYGEIGMSQILEVKNKVNELDDYNVVAILHHHFYLFPEVVKQYGDKSLVRNYTNVIQQLKNMNVKTVLHGHKHFDLERPLITEDYYETTNSIIDVFAGGSVGTARKEKHTFSVIDFFEKKDDIKLIQRKFVYNNEQIEPLKIKQIPPKNTSDRVIELLNILQSNNYDIHAYYIETAEKMNRTYKDCEEIISWTSKALTGFKEVYKFLDDDYRNVLYVLYAIHYRTLSYKLLMGEDNKEYEPYFDILKKFYDEHIINCEECEISVEDYHKLFQIKKLEELKYNCDELISNCAKKATKQFLAFTMVGIFFTDLYLVLTEYADNFYNDSIKYKVNVKLEKNKFHENVPAPRIVLESDADRRSVYVQLLCNEATAHKIAVLFVKEFDLIINKFEDFFKIIGLKLYYLLPKIEKREPNDSVDNYNFEAYIPTLLPLLTGKHIYPSEVVFARELIQNSIDAIAVRAAKEKRPFSKSIIIEIGKDENKRGFFKIVDNGTGMDRFKIERYFTSIGRSFYSLDGEFKDLDITYKPISSFGIGFLSAFMVCKEIDVRTKSYIVDSEGLKLHIPNYDGCFFIEKDSDANVGTEIKLYLNNTEINYLRLVQYIKQVMLDIKFEINISQISINEKNEQQTIMAHSIRQDIKDIKSKIFIPFEENGKVVNLDWGKKSATDKALGEYQYGMLIKPRSREALLNVLNSGILVKESHLGEIMDISQEIREEQFNTISVYANFPSNWLEMDVSREKAILSNDNIDRKNVQNEIASTLHNQITEYFNYAKENEVNEPAVRAHDIICFAYSISKCNKNIQDLIAKLRYRLFCKIDDDSIRFRIGKSSSTIKDYIELSKLKERKFDHYFAKIRKDIDEKSEDGIYSYINNRQWLIRERYYKPIRHYENFRYGEIFEDGVIKKEFLKKYNITKIKDAYAIIIYILGSGMISFKKEYYNSVIWYFILNSFTISDVEMGRNEVLITNKEIVKKIQELK